MLGNFGAVPPGPGRGRDLRCVAGSTSESSSTLSSKTAPDVVFGLVDTVIVPLGPLVVFDVPGVTPAPAALVAAILRCMSASLADIAGAVAGAFAAVVVALGAAAAGADFDAIAAAAPGLAVGAAGGDF